MAVPGGTVVQRLAAVLLCISGCQAQRSPTVSVCLDGERSAVLSQFSPNAPEYQMLLMKYQNDIADGLGVGTADVSVRVPPDCEPERAPPTPPVVSRPGFPPPPPPVPPQTITQNMVIDVSPEYAAAVCRDGSDEQRQMILRFQEQTAAQLSTCQSMRRGTADHGYRNLDCNGCAPSTCLAHDLIKIDPTMFGCDGRQGQTVEHEMEVTVSDEWARTLCGGPGSPGYDATVLQIQTAVAHNLGIGDPTLVAVEQLRSSLDCDTADHNDQDITGNEVFLDITDEYAHQLCDKDSVAFMQFKQAFQRQVAASINDACDPSTLPPGRSCPSQGDPGYITFEQIEVDDQSILQNAHCTGMAHGMPMEGPSAADVDGAAHKANEDSSAFDLAVIVLVVACVGLGYRHKTRPSKVKYQAVNADEEIPLSDYSIDGPSDSGRDRRDNPSFAGQFGAARIASGKRR